MELPKNDEIKEHYLKEYRKVLEHQFEELCRTGRSGIRVYYTPIAEQLELDLRICDEAN
jgi:hypothetical protein